MTYEFKGLTMDHLTCPELGIYGGKKIMSEANKPAKGGMTKQSFTPGPWHVATTGATVLAGRYEEFVADCESDGYNQESVYDQDRNNARLIASAPELLEACKKVVSFWPDKTRSHPDVKILLTIVESAIARAEGKEQGGE